MSNVTRSVSITIYNATSAALTLTTGNGSTFSSMSLAAYSGHTYSGTDTSQALQGSINAVAGALNWSLWYEASSNSDNTYYRTDAATGSLYTYQQNDVGDHSVAVQITLYEGVAASDGYVLKLATAADIGSQMKIAPWVFRDFVECMFSDGVRNVIDAINAEAPKISSGWASATPQPRPSVFYADMTGGQIPNMVDILTAYWMDNTKSCGASDKRLIDFFKSFIVYGSDSSLNTTTIPELYVPRLNFDAFQSGTGTQPAILDLQAYDVLWFKGSNNAWAEDVVRIFLTLLVSGAHVVTMRYSGDGVASKFAGAMDFRDVLHNSQMKTTGDLGNSHYTSATNMTGYYYLDIDAESMPNSQIDDGYETAWPGMLISLMSALTNDGISPGDQFNTFFQLEGWPAHGLSGGTRHGTDFSASTETYWNISTFGACPYSEKRGGSVFIAPPGWTPQVTNVTYMATYYGNWGKGSKSSPTHQSWLQTQLINIDTSTAAAFDTSKIQN